MKLWGIFCFELAYHRRRPATWVYLAAFLGLATWVTSGFVGDAREGGFHFNAPLLVAAVTVITSLIGLLVTAALASEAATRDLQTRLAPLHYTVPVSKATYLGGRLLGAVAVNALLLAAVPLAMLVVARLLKLEPELIGPFRPGAYLSAYLLLALPNAVVSTTLLFGVAVLSRRVMPAYAGAVVLFVLSLVSKEFIADHLGQWTLGKHLDPMGFTVLSALWHSWSPAQKNTHLVGLGDGLLTNRLLWLGLALGTLALAYLRFRFAHHAPGKSWLARIRQRFTPHSAEAMPTREPVRFYPLVPRASAPAVPAATGVTRALQVLGVARHSLQAILTGWGALVVPVLAVGLVLLGPELLEEELGTPSLLTTGRISTLTGHLIIRLMVAALTTMYAGKLVWQEREAGLSELADTAPVPSWVLYTGKFLGLALLLAGLQVLFMAGGMLMQALDGYFRFEVGLYLRLLFGLRLADNLLFAVPAFAGHVLVRDKYVGHLLVFLLYLFTAFAEQLGVGHHLLAYGSDPGWRYSAMNGFGTSLGPWLWFKLYWFGWALLLGMVLMLFWTRGREPSLGWRLRLARRRFTPGIAAATLGAGVLVVLSGGFIFYNTNVLNHYRPEAAQHQHKAEFERRYGGYRNVPQPVLTGTRLHVELYPQQARAQVRGTYRLVNQSHVAIDSIHVVSHPEVRTQALSCDRPTRLALADETQGYHILALYQPLQPGDTLRLHFEQHIGTVGFANSPGSIGVVPNGTWLEKDWLPAVGYQPSRELHNAGLRRQQGLPVRPAIRSVHDAAGRQSARGRERIDFEATIGTDADQTAVAPGALRRSWQERGRRYFHYATQAPIRNIYALFSGRYATHEAQWQNVPIQVLYHPGHAHLVPRLVRSAQASLAHYSQHFGPYPLGQLRLVETPGASGGMRLTAYSGTIMYTEGFALTNPGNDPRHLDLPFAVMAHEVAHLWWGHQVVPAYVEGGALLTESLAWYSALNVVEASDGPERLAHLMHMMRREYLTPRESAAVPLLRATDHFDVYRRGPFAMYALREYLGHDQVNGALRQLLRKHGSGRPPYPVSLDLYNELQAATPDSLRYLVKDLLAANTFWELKAIKAHVEPAGATSWRLSLTINARKVTVDSAGQETQVPLNDFVEVGVYAAGENGDQGRELYRRQHQIQAGTQTLTVTLPHKPASAGIDPRRLLIDRNIDDNFQQIKSEQARSL
ncbi:ABC transporter permease/M1 family aminopeptidase [Hymenobacter koreensis]|uniref:M1 family aminopeptidase n=1 Tax=Hymenobacter koreensis TaxID=1084523 RepID=A0ABP8J2S6_9BACT